MIASAVEKSPENFETGSTAGEWVARRIRKLRIKNRKVSDQDSFVHLLREVSSDVYAQGPETWYDSMGTEHKAIRDITRPLPTKELA